MTQVGEEDQVDRGEAPPKCWADGRAQQQGFGITPKELYDIIESRDLKCLESAGGVEGIARKLVADLKVGLPRVDVATGADGLDKVELAEPEATRRLLYGVNYIEPASKKSFLRFVLETLNDKMLIALCIAAFVQVGIGIYNAADSGDYSGMSDGISIVLVVVLVVLITSINDYRKQLRFRRLNSHSASLSTSNVMRGDEVINIQSSNVVAGDVLYISSGMIIQVDGLLIEGMQLKMNESSVTGESREVSKSIDKDPFILSGTCVLEGNAKILVTAVGRHTLHGRVLTSLVAVPRRTPLQIKLASVAEIVAKSGLAAAGTFLLLLVIAYFTAGGSSSTAKEITRDIVDIVLVCIAVIVIAIPEGLPLSVTLALAYAAINMIKDMCLVRNLSSCETMGCSTSICTDKTGTLTMNTMEVTECYLCGVQLQKDDDLVLQLPSNQSDTEKLVTKMVCCAINMNSSAKMLIQKDEAGRPTFTGSSTEIALVKFTALMSCPSDKDRLENQIVALKPFSSSIKYSGVVFKVSNEAISSIVKYINWPNSTISDVYPHSLVCVTGASEVVMSKCTHVMDFSGNIKAITEHTRSHLQKIISTYAGQALRTLAVSLKVVEGHAIAEDLTNFLYTENLVLCAIIGISDPLRPEVPKAISDCQRAGITVRMVTGDNIETATAISKNCGILSSGDEIVLEGKDFRAMNVDELRKILPRLRVLARSSPMDKQKLVKLLQDSGEVTAVTGDGSNDAPALKRSDVGFSMGTYSTDIAKQASDIVVLDGNFASVSKAILWGRSISNSIKNFLQFQLCVNVSAVIITIITSLISMFYARSIESVFKVVQLLWINLIMDTLAALSLSTDKPTVALYDKKPSRLNESIVSLEMTAMIFIQAAYQIILCLTIYIVALLKKNSSFSLFNPDGSMNKRTQTLIFNTFVFCQVFNEVNCRSSSRYKNVFEKILQNHFFLPIQALIIVLQVILVTFAGSFFGVVKGGLSWSDWLLSIALGAISLPLGYVVRCIDFKKLSRKLFAKRKVSDILPVVAPSTQEDEGKHILLNTSEEISPKKQKVPVLPVAPPTEEPPALLPTELDTAVQPPVDSRASYEIYIPAAEPVPSEDAVGPGWQAARRLLVTIKVLNALGGRLRNEEDLEKELSENLMSNRPKDPDAPFSS